MFALTICSMGIETRLFSCDPSNNGSQNEHSLKFHTCCGQHKIMIDLLVIVLCVSIFNHCFSFSGRNQVLIRISECSDNLRSV